MDAKVLDEIDFYREAVKLYRAQSWELAELQFVNRSKRSPKRALYALYIERIGHFHENPPAVTGEARCHTHSSARSRVHVIGAPSVGIALARMARFCRRERQVTPFRLALSLIESFAGGTVKCIADIQRGFNAWLIENPYLGGWRR